MTRALTCRLTESGAALPALPLDQRERTPWIDRWTFERGGKRWRVAVIPKPPIAVQHKLEIKQSPGVIVAELPESVALVAGQSLSVSWSPQQREAFLEVGHEPIDPREWIESLGDAERWPEGTEFEVVVEEVADAP